MNRAKLYYLRGKVGKKARVRERRYGPETAARATPVERTVEATEEVPTASEEPQVEPEAAAEAEVPAEPEPVETQS